MDACVDDCVEDQLSLAFDSNVGYVEEDSDMECDPVPIRAETEQEDTSIPGWTVVSERYDLIRSPGGSIHSRRKAETKEELEKQQADFEAWLADNGISQDDWAVPTTVPIQRPLPEHDPDFGPEEPTVVMVGRKRRGAEPVKCHYIGCQRDIDQAPLTCPSKDSGQPDYVHPFCSYECMSAWSIYEIGDPLADTLLRLIEHRAGREVIPAPSWFDTMISGIDKLKLAGPIDGKGPKLEEDSSRVHEAKLLPDDATINADEVAQPMEDHDEGCEVLPTKLTLVRCRVCGTASDNREATLRVRLQTCAIWAFCSESCTADPSLHDEEFMTMTEWLDLARKGQAALLRRVTWGTEPDDVDPDDVGK